MVDWWYYNNLFGVEDGLFYENNKRLGYYQDEKEDEILKNNHKATVDRMLELRELNIEFKRINNKLKKENKELKAENEDLKDDFKRCRNWLNSDKYDYELTLAFIKNKGYSLKDVLEYEKELEE